MGKVSILKINQDIKSSLDKSINLIGGISNFFNSNDTVLIKPNLNDHKSFTSISLTESLIQLLSDNSINNIFIAESTFGNGAITDLHFKKTGYINLAKKYGIKITSLKNSFCSSLIN